MRAVEEPGGSESRYFCHTKHPGGRRPALQISSDLGLPFTKGISTSVELTLAGRGR